MRCACKHDHMDHDDSTRPGYPDGGQCQVMVVADSAELAVIHGGGGESTDRRESRYIRCPCKHFRTPNEAKLDDEVRHWMDRCQQAYQAIRDIYLAATYDGTAPEEIGTLQPDEIRRRSIAVIAQFHGIVEPPGGWATLGE